MKLKNSFDGFAVAAPGMAGLVAAEIAALGLAVGEVEEAGVSFGCDLGGLYRANLWSRVASRILVRAGGFKAAHFSELEKGARAIAWNEWLAPGTPVMIRATARKSRLYHTGGIAQRVFEAIARAVPGVTLVTWAEDDPEQAAQLVVVRLERDAVTLSIDSSGALLHRRGYRQAIAKAPLRETLAAAMLGACGYDPRSPLVDPCCGSGTIPIEAAMVARRIPPGLGRSFAFERWPRFKPVTWDRVRDDARSQVLPSAPAPILGSDRDAGAIEAARANAERAGVAADITFEKRALSAAQPPGEAPGLLLVNPPYGERIGEAKALRDLYASLGNLARGRFAGWRVGVLTSDAALVGQLRIPIDTVLRTSNGGIKVALYATPPSPSPT